MAEVAIYWLTRSRTVHFRSYPSLEYATRLCTAIAWSLLPTGPWRPMVECPVAETLPWREVSGRFEHGPVEEIPR